jgi:hypothetical protein
VERVLGLPLIGFAFVGTDTNILNESLCRVVEFLLEQGADPNEAFEGYTMWEYFIHYVHTAWDVYSLSLLWKENKSLKRLLEAFMKRGADLDICCIEDDKVWDRVFNYGSSEHLKARAPYFKFFLIRHVVPSTDLDTRRFKRAESTGSCSTTSTLSAKSSSTTDQSEVSDSNEVSMHENENISFEARHSLDAVIKGCFATEDDPTGADELLELMATLKAVKKPPEDRQS